MAVAVTSEEGATGVSVGLVRLGVAEAVALEEATPECPRAGIPYSLCPSPTSTWGAATSRLAAVATIRAPSHFRRRTVPDTFQIRPSRNRIRPLAKNTTSAPSHRTLLIQKPSYVTTSTVSNNTTNTARHLIE